MSFFNKFLKLISSRHQNITSVRSFFLTLNLLPVKSFLLLHVILHFLPEIQKNKENCVMWLLFQFSRCYHSTQMFFAERSPKYYCKVIQNDLVILSHVEIIFKKPLHGWNRCSVRRCPCNCQFSLRRISSASDTYLIHLCNILILEFVIDYAISSIFQNCT